MFPFPRGHKKVYDLDERCRTDADDPPVHAVVHAVFDAQEKGQASQRHAGEEHAWLVA